MKNSHNLPRAPIERTKHWQWNFAAQKNDWEFKRKLSDHKLTSSKSKQSTMIYVYLNAYELHIFFYCCMVKIEWVFKMHAQVQLYLNFSHCDHHCHGAFQIKLSSYLFPLHLNEICMRFFLCLLFWCGCQLTTMIMSYKSQQNILQNAS